MINRILILVFILIVKLNTLSAQYLMEQDSNILINNMYIQMEVTATVKLFTTRSTRRLKKILDGSDIDFLTIHFLTFYTA